MADEHILQSDADGFLTGVSLSTDELIEEWQGIHESLNGIEESVAGIEKLLKANGVRTLDVAAASTVAQPVKTTIQNIKKETRKSDRPTNRAEARKGAEKRVATTKAARERVAKQPNTRTARESLKQKPVSVIVEVKSEKDSQKRKTAEGTHKSAPAQKRAESAPVAVPVVSVQTEKDKPENKAEKVVTHAKKSDSAGKREVAIPKAKNNANKQKRTPATAAEAESLGKKRDAHGRFIKAGGSAEAVSGGGLSDGRGLGDLAEKVAEAARDAAETVGEADPTVTAIEEVAEPLSRGFSFIQNAWGDSEESGWLRKIFKSIGKFRKDQSTFNKAQKKTLEGIEENTEGGNGGEGGGISIPFIGKISGVLPALAMFAKRIPIVGSVLASIGGVLGVLDSEWDETITREEKDRRTGKAIGGAGGAIGGMLGGAKVGAMLGSFAGPIGTAIGGLVGTAVGGFLGTGAGKIVGETVGGWVAELRSADIPGMVSNAWNAFTLTITNGWNTVTNGITTAWNGVTNTVTAAWTGLTSTVSEAWTGVTNTIDALFPGLLDRIEKTWDNAISGLSDFWDNAKNAVTGWIKDKTGIDVTQIGSKIESAVTSVKETVSEKFKSFWGTKETTKVTADSSLSDKWNLGSTSAQFESGNRGAGAVSSGRGDAGGASYGTYQLSSKAGTLQKFLKQSGYAKDFEGMRPGTHEFNDKWREIAKNDSEGFQAAQHKFIKETHYDKAVQGLSNSGIDLSKRGKAVQDAIWSTSVQFGAGSEKSKGGAVAMFKKALDGRDVSSMSDAEIVTAIQDYKLANNSKLFKSSSLDVRRSTARRASEEKARLLELVESEKDISDTVQGQRALAAVGLGEAPKVAKVGAFLDRKEEREKVAQTEAIASTVSLKEAKETLAKESAVSDSQAFSALSEKEGHSVATNESSRVSDTSKKVREAESNSASKVSESSVFSASEKASAEREKAVATNESSRVSDTSEKVREAESNSASKVMNAGRFNLRTTTLNSILGGGSANQEVQNYFNSPVKTSSMTATANVRVPNVKAPAVVAAQSAKPTPVPTPLASNRADGPTVVKIEQDAGQDVKDRAIAHVVTGGLAL